MKQEIIKFDDKRLENVRLVSLTSDVDVNEFYAEYLLANNDFFKYIQNKNISKSKNYLKKVLKQKIEDMKSSNFKNDGTHYAFSFF